MNCSQPDEGFVDNNDDLVIRFWASPEDEGQKTEVPMIGSNFRIPLPVSKVSPYFDEKPEFVFYPHFYKTEGNFEVLKVEAADILIGNRSIVVYVPPGNSFRIKFAAGDLDVHNLLGVLLVFIRNGFI